MDKTSKLLLSGTIVAVVIAAAFAASSGFEPASGWRLTLRDGSMFISDAGQSHGGFEFTASYNVSIYPIHTSAREQVHVSFVLDVGLGDPLERHDLYVELSWLPPTDEIQLRNGDVNISLIHVDNDTIWNRQYDGYYIASWGGDAPEKEMRGQISPLIFGLPEHYYVELRLYFLIALLN
jgi:hypothetical protein